MSKLYGTLSGRAKTVATRCGTGHHPIVTTAASWAGAINVRVYIDKDDVERFEVTMQSWHGKGDYAVIATGVMGRANSIRYSGGC